MAEPLRNYDRENESATVEPLPRALPEPTAADLREEPYVLGDETTSTDETVSTTERVGNAVGDVIGSLKSRVRSGLRVVSDRSRDAGDAIGDMTDSAQERARELSQQARIRADELRRTARRRFREARAAAGRATNEHPIETILAVGAVGLVVGFLLRIWRSSRD